MSMIFKPGDIIIARKDLMGSKSRFPNTFDIIGRVLNYDIETCMITFDVVIIGTTSNIKTGVIEMFDFGFQLAEPGLAQEFINYINNLPNNKAIDKIFINFVDLFNKADIETKYKIMKYILASDLNN